MCIILILVLLILLVLASLWYCSAGTLIGRWTQWWLRSPVCWERRYGTFRLVFTALLAGVHCYQRLPTDLQLLLSHLSFVVVQDRTWPDEEHCGNGTDPFPAPGMNREHNWTVCLHLINNEIMFVNNNCSFNYIASYIAGRLRERDDTDLADVESARVHFVPGFVRARRDWDQRVKLQSIM